MYFRIHAFSFEIYAKQHQHFNADSINIYKKKKKRLRIYLKIKFVKNMKIIFTQIYMLRFFTINFFSVKR